MIITKEKVKSVLESYSAYKKYVDSIEYAKKYFSLAIDGNIEEGIATRLKLMANINSLVDYLPPSNEQTLLILHYFKDVPIEKCAECLDISTRSCYRLLNKALSMLTYKLKEVTNFVV